MLPCVYCCCCRYLDLSGVQFTGSIPDAVGSLVGLSYAHSPFACSRRLLPSFQTVCAHLRLTAMALIQRCCSAFVCQYPYAPMTMRCRHLDMSNNKLSGPLPSSFGSLVGLTYVLSTAALHDHTTRIPHVADALPILCFLCNVLNDWFTVW